MSRSVLSAVLFTVCLAALPAHAARFADSVVTYHPGVGFATDFVTGAGYTNTSAVLGSPSVVTPGQFGGSVDPFNPPYLPDQLLSVGAGGSLTVRFATPVQNHPANAFGLDFLICGSAGFMITNGDYTGGGITDGSLFSHSPGQTRVLVSADNVTYYRLDPAQAPTVDGLFPTDGSGDFAQPVNPALNHSSFAGQGLAGIRSLYAGSGGGAGYDLSWAVDDRGDSVALPSASYVRVEVLEGHSEIDAFSVVPEPAPGILAVVGTGVLWGLQRRKPGVPPRGSPVRPQDLAI